MYTVIVYQRGKSGLFRVKTGDNTSHIAYNIRGVMRIVDTMDNVTGFAVIHI